MAYNANNERIKGITTSRPMYARERNTSGVRENAFTVFVRLQRASDTREKYVLQNVYNALIEQVNGENGARML